MDNFEMLDMTQRDFLGKTLGKICGLFIRFRCLNQIILLLILGVVPAQAQCSSFITSLIGGPPNERGAHLLTLYSKNVEAIPLLIRDIDDKHIATVSFARPTESFAYLNPMHCGVVAAYLVELILGEDRLLIPSSSDFILGGDPANYVYPLGFVADIRNGKPIRRDEMMQLKSIYSKWWKLNQSKSIRELREDWKSGRAPTAGSPFSWK